MYSVGNNHADSISTHAPRVRRDNHAVRERWGEQHFYSRASCEARPVSVPSSSIICYFYSRASCEARPTLRRNGTAITYFYSRASCEARRCKLSSLLRDYSNFYSRASCEARHPFLTSSTNSSISTHAPRVRRDLSLPTRSGSPLRISTHAPRVRRDCLRRQVRGYFRHFYSRASCEARLRHTADR